MPSFGEELRRERELRRISLREIAETTKISQRHLEALERNDFAGLPGGVFNRGFVRAYAQCIGIDPERMVTAYLMEERAQGNGGDVNTAAAGPVRRWRAWAWVLIALLVVACAAALAAWRYPERIPWLSSRSSERVDHE